MNVFKLENKKLNKLEKAINKYEKFNISNHSDFWKVKLCLFELTSKFCSDLSGNAYYGLYRVYGNAENDLYEEILRMYTYYSKEISWILERRTLTENEFNILVTKYRELKNRFNNLKAPCTNLSF